MRILVVEDEARLATALQRGLQAEGFAVDMGYNPVVANAKASAPATIVLTRALLIPVSFRKESFSVMGVNGHADEHSRQ